jgi:hypothetical protein
MGMWLAHVEELRNEHEIDLQIISFMTARGGALRYKPGRLGVRFVMVPLDFFIEIISPGGKGGRCVGLTTLPLSYADFLEILGPGPSSGVLK